MHKFTFVTFYVAFALVLLEFLLTFVVDSGRAVTSQTQRQSDERTPLLANQSQNRADDVTKKKDDDVIQKTVNPSLSCAFFVDIFLGWFAPCVLDRVSLPQA